MAVESTVSGTVFRIAVSDYKLVAFDPRKIRDCPNAFRTIIAYSIAEYGPTVGGFNCHHGAFGFRRGGWQAVNLPQSRWNELFERWEKSTFSQQESGWAGIPLYWCGRETGTGYRVYASVRRSDSGCQFDYGKIKESDLVGRVAWLNRQLTELGESPVAIDLPNDIDWKRVILWSQSVTNSFRKAGL